jgi:CRP-like cAMP-binding protein
MWDAGVWARVALVAIAVFVLGPLVHGLGEAAASLLGRIRFRIERARFRRELGWRRDAGVAIAGLPMLGDLSMDAVNELAGRVTLRRAARGEVVVRRGERADAFYVVRSGRVHVVDDLPSGDQPVLRSLGAGEAFGELALLQAGPRTATVVAAEDTELFVVDKGSFDRLLAGSLAMPDVTTTRSSIEEVWALPPFRHLAAAEARALAEAGRWQTYPPGADIVRQGEPGDVFYVIAGGRLAVTENGAEVRELVRGDHFGELALLNDAPRSATVTARTPVRLFELDRPAFEVVIASSLRSSGQRTAVHDHAVPVRT